MSELGPPPHLEHEWAALSAAEQRDVLRWAAQAIRRGALQITRDGHQSSRVASQRAFAARTQCQACGRKSALRPYADGMMVCRYCQHTQAPPTSLEPV